MMVRQAIAYLDRQGVLVVKQGVGTFVDGPKPIARPAILTMAVLFFVWSWNDFLLALVLISSEELRTLPLGLAFFQGRRMTNIPLTAAGAIIVAIPAILIYVSFQRQFIRGITGGAVEK